MKNSYKSELTLRKKAIREFFKDRFTQKEVYEDLGKSRYWFEYWLTQYRAKGADGLCDKAVGYPKGRTRKYSANIIDEITNIRQRLEDDPQEYFYGVEKIYQEFIKLGYEKDQIPSIVYIKKILSQHGCVKRTKLKDYVPLKGYPEKFIKKSGLLAQIDFIGYKRIHNYSWPIHFLALSYRELKYGHIWRICAEKSSVIVPLLFDYWQSNPKPHIVQMDNDWPFIGSGSAEGTISYMIRFLLTLGITPLFIPESAPWRNGIVEGANSVFGRKFWQRHEFKNLGHIDKELTVYNNRLKEYKLKTFNINLQQYETIPDKCLFSKKLIAKYRFKDTDIIYFIRLGRLFGKKSGIKILNYLFSIPSEFLNHYILVKLSIVEQIVSLYHETDKGKLVLLKKSKINLNL